MIDKDTYIEDIVEQYPFLIPELARHKIQCVACGEPVWGTVSQQAERKKIANLDTILSEMNRMIDEHKTDKD